jgi:hypothetical protein
VHLRRAALELDEVVEHAGASGVSHDVDLRGARVGEDAPHEALDLIRRDAEMCEPVRATRALLSVVRREHAVACVDERAVERRHPVEVAAAAVNDDNRVLARSRLAGAIVDRCRFGGRRCGQAHRDDRSKKSRREPIEPPRRVCFMTESRQVFFIGSFTFPRHPSKRPNRFTGCPSFGPDRHPSCHCTRAKIPGRSWSVDRHSRIERVNAMVTDVTSLAAHGQEVPRTCHPTGIAPAVRAGRASSSRERR